MLGPLFGRVALGNSIAADDRWRAEILPCKGPFGPLDFIRAMPPAIEVIFLT